MSDSKRAGRLPEVEAFLSRKPLKSFIAGREVGGPGDEVSQTIDPGTGEPLTDVYVLGADAVTCAVEAAAEAFRKPGWADLSQADRNAVLSRFADAVESQKAVIGELEALDCGKLRAHAESDVQWFVDGFRYFIGISPTIPRDRRLDAPGFEAHQVRLPWGPCGFIFPWNFPFLLCGWNIAPALVAGNTVVIKPAQDTPLSTTYMASLAKKVGIPDGVINVVNGRGSVVGDALTSHPGIKRISFTGSPEVGRQVGENCGRNIVPVKLELGGKGAAVVFDDVDLDKTVADLIGAITFHSGQVCCDATRWLVHEKIRDAFVERAVAGLGAVRVGYQLAESTQMGPVASAKQRKTVLDYLQRGAAEGAETLVGGGVADVRDANGFYIKPTLLSGSTENVCAREEIFGPVAYLASFADEDEAVAMVNNTTYGLANSVWAKDRARADRVARRMVSGNSWINCHNVFPCGVPYAGVNQSGLGGGVNSPETLMDYWRNLSVVRPTSG
jgi:acyl-CoA reductase-like NAD-dependent aldehyde dehydrogenase